MKLHQTYLCAAVLILTGCQQHHAPSADSNVIQGGDAGAPASSNSGNSPPADNGDPPATYHILTNEEVIEETHKCEAAGLDGEEWGQFDKNSDPQGATEIRCVPRKHGDDK